MKEEKSKCCNAPTIVHTGEEGTNYYICRSCEQPCDLLGWGGGSMIKSTHIIGKEKVTEKELLSLNYQYLHQLEKDAILLRKAAKVFEEILIQLPDDQLFIVTSSMRHKKIKLYKGRLCKVDNCIKEET